MKIRNIRIGISFFVMGLFILSFFGGEKISIFLSNKLSFFQFTPSLLRFIVVAGGLSSFGFFIIFLLTIVFGRVYCSFLCPLGIFQDVMIFFSRKTIKRRKNGYQKPYNLIRYSILILTVLSSILGTLIFINFLDPYSFFGRIATNLFKPLFVFVNNVVVSIFEKFDIYALSMIELHQITPLILIVTLLLFFILLVMSIFRGRMYCNTICPVGTLLGIVSRFSIFKITINKEKCTSCGQCENECRAGCIDVRNQTVDPTRCVVCFDCLKTCSESAVEYNQAIKKKDKKIDLSRRNLLKDSVSTAGSMILLNFPLRLFSKKIVPEGKSVPITPPGSLSVDHFTATCTACHLCVSACPSKVIKPTFLKYGLAGIMQPSMDFKQGYCEYECNICGKVCPTGAIQSISLEKKKLIQIGKVHFIEDYCVVYKNDEDCGACAEICPTHAVFTVERDNVFYIETDVDFCIGCGACEHVCPEVPKAIFVDGNRVHEKAKKPFSDEEPVQIQAPQDYEDFPF